MYNVMFRYSSILERNPPYLGSSSDLGSLRSLPPPSPSLRRSSTHDILHSARLRKSATFDPPEYTRDYLDRDPSSVRDTPTISREGSVYSPRDGSVYSTRDSPNYSRYSSTLDDKHNWGFSTLRRRNSRSSNSSAGYP